MIEKKIGNYTIYGDGRIYLTHCHRFIKPTISKDGYCRCQFNGRLRLTHRVIAQALIPNPDNLPVVNHKNGIRHDNRVENLEWVSSSDNQKHAYRMGLRLPAQLGRSGSLHHRSKIVISIKDTAIIEHESMNKCAEYLGGSRGNMYKAITKGYSYMGHKLYML